MPRAGRIVFVFIIALGVVFPLAYAQNPPDKSRRDTPIKDIFSRESYDVEAVADSLEYQQEQKKVIAKGNVVLSYGNKKITSDYAEVETDTKKAYVKGHVIVFQNNEPMAHSDEAYYNFDKDSGDFPHGRLIETPWYTTGEDAKQIRKGLLSVRKGAITTCDREKPHYEVRAKRVTIYSGEKLIAKDVTFYVLGKPIFWWPYLVIPLDIQHIPLTVTGGYNSELGAYVETTKGYRINKYVGGKIEADWRSLRGIGGGATVDYDFGKYAYGSLHGYLTQDKRGPNPKAASPFAELRSQERGWLNWRHRTDLDLYSNILLRYNRIADEFFLQEFFHKEYRSEVEPQSFVTLTKNSERYGFYTHLEKQMNTFESVVERLPEVRFDWKNQPFLKPWVFYDSQLSYVNLNKKFGRAPGHESAERVDNLHEWFAPMKWREIKLTPSVFMRGTNYSRGRTSGNDEFRAAGGGAVDLRTQIYKPMNVSTRKLGIEINHLRHVVEPSVQVKMSGSNVHNDKLSYFDSIERVDEAGLVTFGLENRLQTKRVVQGKMQRVDVVSLNTYLSYEFANRGQINAPVLEDMELKGHDFTILNQEIVLRPYDWLQYEARADFDMQGGHFRELNQDIVLKNRRFKILFGQRFIQNIPESVGSDQYVFDGKWILNPLWTVGGYIRWDAKQPFGQNLEEWQLSAVRDLHDFLLDFGYNVRKSTIHSTNQTLYATLKMKAFPFVAVRGGSNYASFSEPRIGETVAGANQSPHVGSLLNENDMRVSY